MPKSKGRFGRGKKNKVPYGKTLMTRLRNGGMKQVALAHDLMGQITPKIVSLAVARYNIHLAFKAIEDNLSRLIGDSTGNVRDLYIERRNDVREYCTKLEEIDKIIHTCQEKIRDTQSRVNKLDEDMFAIELMDLLRTASDLMIEVQAKGTFLEKESPEIFDGFKTPEPKSASEVMAFYDAPLEFPEISKVEEVIDDDDSEEACNTIGPDENIKNDDDDTSDTFKNIFPRI